MCLAHSLFRHQKDIIYCIPTIHDAFCFSQSFIIINTITNKWKKKSPSSTKRTLHLISDNYTLIINRMFRFGWKPHSTHKQVIWLQSMLFTVTSSFRTFTWFPLNMCLHLYPNTIPQPCQAKKQIGDGAFLKMPRPRFADLNPIEFCDMIVMILPWQDSANVKWNNLCIGMMNKGGVHLWK